MAETAKQILLEFSGENLPFSEQSLLQQREIVIEDFYFKKHAQINDQIKQKHKKSLNLESYGNLKVEIPKKPTTQTLRSIKVEPLDNSTYSNLVISSEIPPCLSISKIQETAFNVEKTSFLTPRIGKIKIKTIKSFNSGKPLQNLYSQRQKANPIVQGNSYQIDKQFQNFKFLKPKNNYPSIPQDQHLQNIQPNIKMADCFKGMKKYKMKDQLKLDSLYKSEHSNRQIIANNSITFFQEKIKNYYIQSLDQIEEKFKFKFETNEDEKFVMKPILKDKKLSTQSIVFIN